MDGIKNVDEYGNPYRFYRDIMSYLDTKHNSISMERYDKSSEVSKFYNSPNMSGETPDIVVINLTDNYNSLSAQSSNYTKKPIRLKYNGAVYELDSVISRDISKLHFCCGIICNNESYLFDGGAFSKLSKRNWRKWINEDYTWQPKGSQVSWNFVVGYTMFFYYRIT